MIYFDKNTKFHLRTYFSKAKFKTRFSQICFSFSIFFLNFLSFSQPLDSFTYSNARDAIFSPSIHSVFFYQTDRPLSYPFIPLNPNHSLVLSFDDLDEEVHNFYYRIENYDAQWNQRFTDIINFIDGFEQNFLNDYELSNTSAVSYRHYSLQIPNNDIRIKRPGNYLLTVYNASTHQPVLSRRFVVFDNEVEIKASVNPTSKGSFRFSEHELRIQINLMRLMVNDVFSDLSVVVIPNFVWEQSQTILRPEFINDKQLSYRHTIAPGNEFRTLNLREINQNNSSIERIQNIHGISHIYLSPDFIRANAPYAQSSDFNGLAFTNKIGSYNPDLDGEYFYVHFRLSVPQPFSDGNVFIFGALSSFSFSERNKMNYNPKAGEYQATLFLKNGYYDYQYVIAPNPDNSIKTIDFQRIEGSFGQTENEYYVLVYVKDMFQNCQTLKGFTITKLPR